MLSNIFINLDLVSKLRKEALPLLYRSYNDSNTATIRISRLEAKCPILLSCYRETLRVASSNISMRRTLKDTTILDSNGREYLLKKSINVQIAGRVLHIDKATWGANAHKFNLEQFITISQHTNAEEKN